MIFTKMQLNGNDFIFVNNFNMNLADPKNVAREICRRRFGVGADGLILVLPSNSADFKIEIYNSNGSRAKICGNAVLSLGSYLFNTDDFKLKFKDHLDNIEIETDSGIKRINIETSYDEIISISVNMGKPIFDIDRSKYPDYLATDPRYDINYISVGNLHGVIVIKDLKSANIDNLVLKNSLFDLNNDFNLDFIDVVNRNEINIKTYERGVGETLSCGSGACAAVVIAVKYKLCDRNKDILVRSEGGLHTVKYSSNDDLIIKAVPKLVYNAYLRF